MLRRSCSMALAALLSLVAVACGDGSDADHHGACTEGDLGCPCYLNNTCNQEPGGTWLVCGDGVCRTPTCPQGTLGCGCSPDAGCSAGLTCASSSAGLRCQMPDCTLGNLDCGCLPDRTCNADATGQLLACDGTVCVRPTCVQGQAGCACRPDYGCDDGSACGADGRCAAVACDLGTLGCACLPDGSCVSANLACTTGGRCESRGCPEGTAGCPCFGNSTCFDPLVCNAGTCISGGGGVPANPACYTPCRSDLTLDGGTRVTCSPEGLLPGCVGGTSCVRGSCVAPDGSVPGCSTDLDCPDHQGCVSGRCYSDCAAESDCTAGKRCQRHVCRTECSIDQQGSTGTGYCASTDGQNGVQRPLADPSGGAPSVVDGSFALSVGSRHFTNVHTSDSFRITNSSSQALEFTVRKLQHTYYDSAGFHNVNSNALSWMKLGEWGHAVLQQEAKVLIDPGAEKRIVLAAAANQSLSRWDGIVEVSHPQLGAKRVMLSYAEVPDGQWRGVIYYFSHFEDAGLDAWAAGRNSGLGDDAYRTSLEQVSNAFIQKWGLFRKGWIGYDELEAALQTTVTGSWSWPATRSLCPWPNGACFLFDNPAGYVEYSSDLQVYPVPSGVSDLTMAVNLRPDPNAGDARVFSGRISSRETPQYAGDPGIGLTFERDPAGASSCSATAYGACLTYVTGFQAESWVGGRYRASSQGCSLGGSDQFDLAAVPWIVPGFTGASELDSASGRGYAYECRSRTVPFGLTDADGNDMTPQNHLLATANPVPDGRARRRQLELIDGALVNQEDLTLIVREHFDSFLGDADGEGFNAYAVIVLKRFPATLEDADYQGAQPTPPAAFTSDVLHPSCSRDLLDTILGSGTDLTAANAKAVARAVIQGDRPSQAAPTPIAATDAEKVHYYCEDSGFIDGGKSDTGAPTGVPLACQWGSRVRFFTLQTQDSGGHDVADCLQPAIAALSCQQATPGTCQQTLNDWSAAGHCGIRLDPVWRCSNAEQVYCENDRLDLRKGKVFYRQDQSEPIFPPIWPEIDNAFRYKVRFQSRTSAATVGFAPRLCVPDSDAVPYCYDPPAIDRIRDRVDCAVHLFTDHYGDLEASGQQPGDPPSADQVLLRDYLRVNFGRDDANGRDGFERLSAELLIMMGDDAYTRAFASRFDLAGQQNAAFEGSKFEPGGIDLGGGAGYEMYSLYQALQYYQLALDRFYSLAPVIYGSVNAGATDPNRNFVTQETVVSYFDRLIRASAQRTRVAAEIARRYHGLGRSDLAGQVIGRAYVSAYLESVVLSRMMRKVVDVTSPTKRAQILLQIERTQRTYRAALLDMRDVYTDTAEDVNPFGFAPDYVPFPALDPADTNAFDKVLADARQKATVAATKEDLALAATRAFDTDAASFQAELTQIRQNYEGQLANLCGTFVGTDGRVHPAIAKYAYLSDTGRLTGDLCGSVGNGGIHDAYGDLEIAAANLDIALKNYANLVKEIEIERQRVADFCQENLDYASFMFDRGEERNSLGGKIAAANAVMDICDRMLTDARWEATIAKCMLIAGTSAGSDCPSAMIGLAKYKLTKIATTIISISAKVTVAALKKQVEEADLWTAYWQTTQQCNYAQIDSNAKTKTLALGLDTRILEVAKANLELQQVRSTISQLRNQATRLEQEQSETEDMTINVAAARNDPNVRIYKNDAVISADRTFREAITAAYKATKVYEYYTSQSYAKEGNLYLVRMVGHGDYNLESYLTELSDAFTGFEEQYGNPDLRVAIYSLRDDILDIPRVGPGYRVLTDQERVDLFRQKLQDPALLDGDGYIAVPFNTTLARLSPLTRNHKIAYVEAEIIGSDTGDSLGRVYLRQRGTGTVRAVDGTMLAYKLPEHTAVINTFFNGKRWWVFSADDVLRNLRLRDLPLVNTRWELVLNLKDEYVNRDINPNSLTDVRLYLYYTDFTSL
jgi:hypothetical protein